MHTMTTNQTNVLMLWACNIMVLREGMLFTRCILSLFLLHFLVRYACCSDGHSIMLA